MELSTQAVGRAGEFQAAAIFERHGVVTSHVDIHGVDLWVETPSGRRVTVQVKTQQRAVSRGTHVTPRYKFSITKNSYQADLLCFVALDRGLCRLLSCAELNNVATKMYPAHTFTEEVMRDEIKRYLY